MPRAYLVLESLEIGQALAHRGDIDGAVRHVLEQAMGISRRRQRGGILQDNHVMPLLHQPADGRQERPVKSRAGQVRIPISRHEYRHRALAQVFGQGTTAVHFLAVPHEDRRRMLGQDEGRRSLGHQQQ
ncbi:hypothetical protein D3C77_609360 [compost metagenome]